MHGEKESRTGYQLLIVHVSAVHPRWRAADPARHLRRRHADASKEGRQGNFDSRAESRDPALLIEWNNFRLSIRKIVRQETEAGPEAVVGIGNREPNGHDSDLEDITGLGAFNVNWPGQDMATGAFVGHFLENVSIGLLDLFGRQTSSFQLRGACTRGERLNFNRVAGLNAQHGRRARVVESPGYRFRSRLQRVRFRPLRLPRAKR